MAFRAGFGQVRYVPQEDDLVLGTVLEQRGDNYLVDIGCAQQCNLSRLAYKGATKSNPLRLPVCTNLHQSQSFPLQLTRSFQASCLVYGRIVSKPTQEPTMVCTDHGGQSIGLGRMLGGSMAYVPLAFARR
jgi:exosome complex component RRP40